MVLEDIRRDFTVWESEVNRIVLTLWSTNLKRSDIVVNHFEPASVTPRKESIDLNTGALRVMNTPNAGGNSVWSEAISVEMLSFIYRAVLNRTEMEIEYVPGSKITDYSIKVFGMDIGVSVTRAMKYNNKAKFDIFTEDDALRLLQKKLRGINESTINVVSQIWDKQILHIWTQYDYMSEMLWDVYEKMDLTIKSNSLVLITVCNNADWIFTNK